MTLPGTTTPGIQHLPTTNKVWKVAALGSPAKLEAYQNTSTSLTLRWPDGTTHESGYRVYQILPDGTRTLRTTVGANTASAVIAGLDATQAYQFAVVAYTDGIESLPALVNASTSLVVKPTNTDDANRLTWALPASFDPSTASLVPHIERSVDGGAWEDVATVLFYSSDTFENSDPFALKEMSFDDANVTSGAEYQYRITPVSYAPAPAYTETTLPTITSVAATYRTQPQWTTQSTTATLTWPDGATPPTSLTFTITDLATGATSQQTVQAAPINPGAISGSGEYIVNQLAPERNYNITTNAPTGSPADPNNPAPAIPNSPAVPPPTPIKTKVFIDRFEVPLTPSTTGPAIVLQPGETSTTLKATDIGEHAYVRASVLAWVSGFNQDTKTAVQVVAGGTMEVKVGSETFTVQGTKFVGAEGETVRSMLDSDWTEHNAASLALNVKLQGIGGGLNVSISRGTDVTAGTPTVSMSGGGDIFEGDTEGHRDLEVTRVNDVALYKDLYVDIDLSPTGTASYIDDYNGLVQNVLIKANERGIDGGPMTLRVVNDSETEAAPGQYHDLESAFFEIKAGPKYHDITSEAPRLRISDNSDWWGDADWIAVPGTELPPLPDEILKSNVTVDANGIVTTSTVRSSSEWVELAYGDTVDESNQWGEDIDLNFSLSHGENQGISIQFAGGLVFFFKER